MGDPISLDCSPPVWIGAILWPEWRGTRSELNAAYNVPGHIDPSVRPKLLKMMIDGETAGEREAAARTLVAWPPERYKLRLAEWGVWIANAQRLALARTILDEIPPFVHRTGNPTSSFGVYYLYPNVVTKPIIHLTSDVALSADLEVRIREGRPWFAYPCPDDFSIGTEPEGAGSAITGFSTWNALSPTTMPTDDFLAPAIAALADCREGYPWLVPYHRLYPTDWQGNGVMYSLGLRWQSVIVLPNRPSWMSPPQVPADPRFAWWEQLRHVPSSWVCNRGETERFLYYDGPTKSAVPVSVSLENAGSALRFTPGSSDAPPVVQRTYFGLPTQDVAFDRSRTDWRKELPKHEGLYIDVRSGVVRGQAVRPITELVPLGAKLPLEGEEVVDALWRMLVRYGLTDEEADGLVTAWTPQLFRTEGRRFVLRMSPEEYARQCPMQCRPTPSEVVRLGLVLSEFDPPHAAEPTRH